MKTPLAILFIVLICAAAFLAGRGKSGGQAGKDVAEPNTRTVSSQSAAPPVAKTKPKANTRTGPGVMTLEKATAMRPEERISLLKKAAVLADPEKQADILVGLISAMTQDELVESTRSLLDAQRKGNAWSQEVWNALWTQWGRVNPEACLALSKTGERYPGWNGLNGLNTYNDYRCLMAGWLEIHPEKAMDWAKQPKDNLREAMGSAFAITSSANGDLKQMEAAILSMSGDAMTMKACFNDYFDLANSNGEKPAALYERMDPKLREAAWTETLERLGQGDLDEAASWYAKHGSDPGSESEMAAGLIGKLSAKDPAGTMKWAAGLPAHTGGSDGRAFYPAEVAFSLWRERDRDAANEWLSKQSAKTPWISRMSQPSTGHEPPEVPEAD
jgi:hypothetical protein